VLGLLVEGTGSATDRGGAVHEQGHGAAPALHESMAKLRNWGVQVLYGDDVASSAARAERPVPEPVPVARALQAAAAPVSRATAESSPEARS
jgi:hypothetical protein